MNLLSFLHIGTVVLVICKLAGWAQISWLTALAPSLFCFALGLTVLVVSVIGVIVAALVSRR